MDLLVLKCKVPGYDRKYELNYELWSDRRNALCRKQQLYDLPDIVSIEIIPIELEKFDFYEDL